MTNWATSQRNLTIFVSIFAAFPLSRIPINSFRECISGSFLLLVTLAVGVPTAYDEYWPQYDQTWKAIGWILLACAVVTIEFIGLYIVGTEYLDLTPLYASAGAFLVTDLGNLAWLSFRQRT
ncbi:hypothetical protein ACFQL0_15900 [Haloplanus litoreus]|uniref:hypothetical protein n=1 Tax=Haloplanus litoreus TaxID=767515 RepID=UPI003612D72E